MWAGLTTNTSNQRLHYWPVLLALAASQGDQKSLDAVGNHASLVWQCLCKSSYHCTSANMMETILVDLDT